MLNVIKFIAFYLPQFHPIPENDVWWGKGFTEWTNVAKAKPLFPGHYQPRIPTDDIGYYDLSDPKVMEKQISLAKEYGIYGFCFYHYWFNGKLLLEKPLELFLKNKDLDFNFCLCWANEPWSRKWHGHEEDVLQPQRYGGKEDWLAHFKYLLPFFQDKRAITVDGKPVFLIYRIGHIAHANEMINSWQEEAKKHGLPGIYIISALQGHQDSYEFKGRKIDAVYEFLPYYPPIAHDNRFGKCRRNGEMTIFDYDFSYRAAINGKNVFPVQYRGVFVSWDNSPRRGSKSYVWESSTPQKYKFYLKKQIKKTYKDGLANKFIFINAWNEWAESAYLEPDQKYGRAYLEATKDALEEFNKLGISMYANFLVMSFIERSGQAIGKLIMKIKFLFGRYVLWRLRKG